MAWRYRNQGEELNVTPLTPQLEQEFAKRGFSRRSFGKLATMIAAGSRMSVPPGAPTKATLLPTFHSVSVRSVQTHLTPGP